MQKSLMLRSLVCQNLAAGFSPYSECPVEIQGFFYKNF
nr:MAG TPA: hypothetical protein [Caudoviricetes sp.]